MIKKFLIVLCVCAFCGYAHADKYVSTTGDDSTGDGSQSLPWATLDYALSSAHTDAGETIWLLEGTYLTFNGANTSTAVVLGTGDSSGTVTIRPYSGTVTLDCPLAASTYWHYLGAYTTTLIFQDISFTNSQDFSGWLFASAGNSTVYLIDCDVDWSTGGYVFRSAINSGDELKTLRSKIKFNTRLVSNDAGSTYISIDLRSSLLHQIGSDFVFLIGSNNASSVYLSNNTFCINGSHVFVFSGAPDSISIANNIFYKENDSNCTFNSNAALESWANTNNGGDFKFLNNIIYFDETELTVNHFNNYMMFNGTTTGGYMVVPDRSNRYLDPSFTNATTDFSISSDSKITGLGNASYLPSGGDINGNSWIGNDVGCYAMPSSDPYNFTIYRSAGFVGDSIMASSGSYCATSSYFAANVFTATTGVSTCPTDSEASYVYEQAAISGLRADAGIWLVDMILSHCSPKWWFIALGINNFYPSDGSGDNTPDNVTAQEITDCLEQMMLKIEENRGDPIWLGITSMTDGYTEPASVNSLMQTLCSNNGWESGDLITAMLAEDATLASFYDDNGSGGLSSNPHPDCDGQEFIGEYAAGLDWGVKNRPMSSVLGF